MSCGSCIGLIVLAGIVYLAIWVIENFIYPIPEQVKKVCG